MARLDPDHVFPSIYRCSLYPEGLGCSKRTRRRHLQADIQLGKQVVNIQEDRDLDMEFDTRSLEPTTRYKSLYIEKGDQLEAAKSLVDNEIEEDLSLIDSKDLTDRCKRLELLA